MLGEFLASMHKYALKCLPYKMYIKKLRNLMTWEVRLRKMNVRPACLVKHVKCAIRANDCMFVSLSNQHTHDTRSPTRWLGLTTSCSQSPACVLPRWLATPALLCFAHHVTLQRQARCTRSSHVRKGPGVHSA